MPTATTGRHRLAFGFPYRFFTGTAPTSTEIPWRWDVAINGHGYMIDTAEDFTGPSSVPVQRAQADTSYEPGEQSLNRDELWRRALESWHLGAGIIYQDVPDDEITSQRFGTQAAQRFYASQGIDPWQRHQFSLLHDTTNVVPSANSNLRLAVAGAYLYAIDGTAVKYSTDGVAWSTATGSGANAKNGLASDGQYIYASDGSDIYRATPGGAFSVYNTQDATLLAYVKGRLMAVNGASILNITSGTPPTAAVFTHGSTGWTWVGFAEGTGYIYAAGYAGTTSLIYRITVQQDGVALAVPVVAGQLPVGETVTSITGYLGLLLVGTTRGFRLASVDANGDLRLGAVVTAPGAVRCAIGADRFVWFGWSNPDAAHTGLGRIDLSQYSDPAAFAPAYASDLQAAGQGLVVDVTTFADQRYFAVSGLGIFKEATTYVASGYMESGWITWRLPEDKVADTLDIRTDPLIGGGITAEVSNGSSYVGVGSTSVAGKTGLRSRTAEIRAERFRVKVTLTSDSTHTPTVHRITLMAVPVPARSLQWEFSLLLKESLERNDDTEGHYDTEAEIDRFKDYLTDRVLVPFQIGTRSYRVQVTDFRMNNQHRNEGGRGWSGSMRVAVKTIARRDD